MHKYGNSTGIQKRKKVVKNNYFIDWQYRYEAVYAASYFIIFIKSMLKFLIGIKKYLAIKFEKV